MKRSPTILLSLVLLLLFHSCTDKRFGFRKKYRVETRSVNTSHKSSLDQTDSTITAGSEEGNPILLMPTPLLHAPSQLPQNPPIQADVVKKKNPVPIIKQKSQQRSQGDPEKKLRMILFIIGLTVFLLLFFSVASFTASTSLFIYGFIFTFLFVLFLFLLIRDIIELAHKKLHPFPWMEIIKIFGKFLLFLGVLTFVAALALSFYHLFGLGLLVVSFPHLILNLKLTGLILTFLGLSSNRIARRKREDS